MALVSAVAAASPGRLPTELAPSAEPLVQSDEGHLTILVTLANIISPPVGLAADRTARRPDRRTVVPGSFGAATPNRQRPLPGSEMGSARAGKKDRMGA
jgi:hypothetical protein